MAPARAFVAAAAAVFLSSAAAMQFDLEYGRVKCLQEVMSKHDVAKGSFHVVDVPEGTPSGVEVKVTGPNGEVEMARQDASSAKLGFTAGEGGAHKVCFTNTGHQQRRIIFDFAAGANAKDYSALAKKEHLKPLELELRKIEDRVEGVYRELQYQREREEEHRNTNESTNARVQWFSLLTILIVLATAAAQVSYLFNFFKRKKMM